MPPPGIPGRSDPGHHSFSNPPKVPRSRGPKVSAGGALEVRMRARDCYWAAEQVGASAATGLASAGDPFNPRVLSVINLSGHTFILDRPPLPTVIGYVHKGCRRKKGFTLSYSSISDKRGKTGGCCEKVGLIPSKKHSRGPKQ